MALNINVQLTPQLTAATLPGIHSYFRDTTSLRAPETPEGPTQIEARVQLEHKFSWLADNPGALTFSYNGDLAVLSKTRLAFDIYTVSTAGTPELLCAVTSCLPIGKLAIVGNRQGNDCNGVRIYWDEYVGDGTYGAFGVSLIAPLIKEHQKHGHAVLTVCTPKLTDIPKADAP